MTLLYITLSNQHEYIYIYICNYISIFTVSYTIAIDTCLENGSVRYLLDIYLFLMGQTSNRYLPVVEAIQHNYKHTDIYL